MSQQLQLLKSSQQILFFCTSRAFAVVVSDDITVRVPGNRCIFLRCGANVSMLIEYCYSFLMNSRMARLVVWMTTCLRPSREQLNKAIGLHSKELMSR